MKRNKIRYDRWLRTLFLAFALLTGGGGWMVWGQTTGTNREIKLEYSTQNGYYKHDSVFVETKEIYVVPGRERELFIPELRISIATKYSNNDRYNWYVHWYVKSNNGQKGTIGFKQFTTTKDEAALQGGDWVRGEGENSYTTTDYFVTNTGKDGGLVWSKRLKNHFQDKGGYGMDASTIIYTAPDGYQDGDIVYCDVSTYQDGSLTNGVYTEPTLTKRTKYIIKHYNQYKDLESVTCYYPAIRNAMNYDGTGSLNGGNLNRTINFSMPSLPNNYFWKDGEDIVQGEYFQYKVDGVTDSYKKFHLTTRKNTDNSDISLNFQQTQRIPKEIYDKAKQQKDLVVRVQVANSKAKTTKDIATYTFSPVEDMGFEIENNIRDDNSRYPRRNGDRYELIGSVDFDLGNPITNLTNEPDNIADKPFGYFSENQTTYGFWNKTIYPLLRTNWNGSSTFFSTNNQNMYGLFRSASQFTGKINQSDTYGTWDYQYYFPVLISADKDNFKNVEFYDRTYYISQDKSDPVNAGQESLQKKYGHFYYVDASNEPGTVVNVPINGTICPNTEITVTAWLADMTRANWIPGLRDYPLAPNLNILFKGKNGDTEEVLHRFTTGDALVNYSNDGAAVSISGTSYTPKYNSYLMQWQQLYYTFVLENNVVYEKYYLEIQNNEPHTDGADYAIDDIRIFRRKPEVSIIQAGNLCDTEVKTVQYVSSYSNIMTVMGLEENEKILEENINHDVKWNETPQELKDYILKTKNLAENEAKEYVESHFTKVYYSVYEYDEQTGGPKNTPLSIDYDGDGKKEYYRMSFLSTVKEDMKWVDPSFNSEGKDAGDKIYSLPLEIGEFFTPETKYIARISSQPLQEGNLECGNCALTGDPFQLSVAGDRFTIFGGDDLNTEISSPEKAEQGETYKIAGRFSYLDNGTWKELEDAKFDWFIGTLEEFNTLKVTLSGKEYTIAQLLPTISTSTEIASEAIIKALTEQYGVYGTNTNGKFVFSQHDFEYTMANKYQTIIGLPHALQDDGTEIDENLYCPDPVVIQLGPTPPTIDPGDPDTPDPKDPEDPKDPDPKDPEDPNKPQPDDWNGKHVRSVRVMLTQIQDMQTYDGTLRIPIHFRKSADGEQFSVNQHNNKIMVVKTSDPNWNVNKEVATLTELADQYIDLTSTENNTPKWNTHYFKIKFEVNNGFREGFWYMVDIPYQVVDNKQEKVYEGSMKLTLKIVPEYVTWVGSADGMHNWNNDGPSHWRRSNDEELYTTNVANVNGTHTEAYTPMRFTKVTVYGKAQKTESDYNTDGKAYAAYPHLYQLNKQATTGLTNLLDMAPADMDAEIGAATKNIEYDLLADPDYEQELFGSVENLDKEQGHSYACVRFYGNTCDEIYIKPESEILHTEFLTYNKAHVDYEMAPNRWYMLASPLKGVVSGDMYLPTGTGNVGKYARQDTPAFGEINYDNTNYTRWEPAVYMRGWDKTKATVVRPDGTEPKYGIKGSWSNLYNDVDVLFKPGTGFSIGTKTGGTTVTNNKVLFRLPKADNAYKYYGNTNSNEGNETTLTNRDGNGRFYFSDRDKDGKKSTEQLPVTFTYDESKGMIGNPFMSHLNMKEFFKQNQSLGNTYYIMGESATETVLLGDEYTLTTNDSYNGDFLAPLQSFIVKREATEATFTTDMIAKAPTTGKLGLRSATVAPVEDPLPQLRITATRGGVRNTAVVAGFATASDSYVEGEDAALLINEEVAAPQVYTLAGNQMVAINVTPDLAEIPVGIHGKDATPVELSFKLSGAMKNVKLVDKQTGKRYDVTDGLTLTVPGNTSGRYFLNGSIATSNEIIARNHIIFYNSAPGRIDVSSVDALSEVTVYDISGRALRTLRNLNTPTASVDHLAPGIYVVRAESGSQVVSEKVEVR